jgi:hypothetical protein
MNYLDELKSEFDRIKPVESYLTNGQYGVIYVGGGKYWPGIAVGIKLLRQYSTLPVEVWYRGKCEEVYPDDIKDCENVTYYDIDEMSDRLNDNKVPQGIVSSGGWEAKLYVMMHTRFSKVLYLDADAYVVANPWGLFNYIRNKPFAFWRDLPNHLNSIRWKDVWPNGDNGVIPVQGGQLLIDRNKAWKLIHVCHYMCQNSDYYFRYMYGDQDTWRVGLAMGCCDYEVIGNADWQSPAFVCKANSFTGGAGAIEQFNRETTYIVHRCQGKLFDQSDIPIGKNRYSNPQYHLPLEQKVFEHLATVLNNHPKEASKVFKNIYDKRLWGNHGSPSGAGSTIKEARLYIDTINRLIRSKKWETLIDVGCGDGLVGSKLECKKYIGYDCVTQMIQRCKIIYKKEYFALDIFQECDIIHSGDVLICKDVLHHWPNKWIVKWLSKLIESNKWKAIILCQDSKQLGEHSDTFLGGYRALNYKLYPLNLFPFQFISHVHHKDILLWERK